MVYSILGEIALAQAISPIATHFSVAWSVVRQSHSCTVLKPFDKFTCHLAGTLAASKGTDGVPDPQGKGEIGG